MNNSSILQTSKRNSSIELLRIIAMSAILIYHFFVHGSSVFEESPFIKSLVISFLYWGVNVFIMISGYCGLKLKLYSFLKLYTTVAIFIIVNILTAKIFGADINIFRHVRMIIFPFSCGGYWFMAAYLGLLATTPVLSNALPNLSLYNLRKVVFILFIFNIFCGGFNKNLCNVNGYTYMQFLFMYITGHWMARDTPKISTRNYIAMFLGIGIVEMCVWAIYEYIVGHPMNYFMNYNNICVVCQSVCIFAVFTKYNFTNRFINNIASASLGCYLIQDGLFGFRYLYPFVKQNHMILYYIIAWGGVWAISLIITRLKNKINPLLLILSKKIEYLFGVSKIN